MIGIETGSSAAAMFQAQRPVSLDRRAAGALPAQGRDQAREVARQFVGETFFGLLLKELRKSTSGDHLLSGGAGEAVMRPYFDQVLAQRMAQSRHFALSDAVAEEIGGAAPGAEGPGGVTGGER